MLLITLSLAAVIALNITANVLPLNGQTTGEISDRLSVLFTPAGYVFSIWPVIYLLLAVWAAAYWKQFKGGFPPSYKVTTFFMLSAVLNISWLLSWHYEFFLLSVVIMTGYLFALLGLYFQYEPRNRLRIPISVNMGWVTVALIANIAYVLAFFNWGGWGISDGLWTVVMLTAATALALHIRYHYDDIWYPSVFIWAFIGIAVENALTELLVSTASLFLSGVILAGILFIRKRRIIESD
ncbi:TspO/MBR family protein [Planococcus lenghuensis]